jgi:hypothetical protein
MRTRLFALLAAAALFSTGPLAAEHAHHGHDAPRLALDHGKKWPTDEPLRQGMGGVRGAMARALPAIHADQAKPGQYRELAGTVRREVSYIVANCRLAPDADAMLHLVIAELLAGADAMEGKSAGVLPRAGAVRVVQALDDYGRHFNHPGWQPLAH